MLQKVPIVRAWFFKNPEATHRLYVWRPGSDDYKLIFAIDDESAVRIAIQARIDHNEMSEKDAFEAVMYGDLIASIDPDTFYQGEAPLWDGALKVGNAVRKV